MSVMPEEYIKFEVLHAERPKAKVDVFRRLETELYLLTIGVVLFQIVLFFI